MTEDEVRAHLKTQRHVMCGQCNRPARAMAMTAESRRSFNIRFACHGRDTRVVLSVNQIEDRARVVVFANELVEHRIDRHGRLRP